MIPQTKKPPAPLRSDGFQNISQRRYFIKKPPYANTINLSQSGCLWVLTGSGAWNRAKLRYWLDRAKVVLPIGDDPAHYDWSIVRGIDVVIGGFGELEPLSTIAQLGGLLLAAGACLVIYAPEHGPVTRIDARKETA